MKACKIGAITYKSGSKAAVALAKQGMSTTKIAKRINAAYEKMDNGGTITPQTVSAACRYAVNRALLTGENA